MRECVRAYVQQIEELNILTILWKFVYSGPALIVNKGRVQTFLITEIFFVSGAKGFNTLTCLHAVAALNFLKAPATIPYDIQAGKK